MYEVEEGRGKTFDDILSGRRSCQSISLQLHQQRKTVENPQTINRNHRSFTQLDSSQWLGSWRSVGRIVVIVGSHQLGSVANRHR